MSDIIMKREHTDRWTKMRLSRARSSGPEASSHMLSSVDCITTTSASEFSVHTGTWNGNYEAGACTGHTRSKILRRYRRGWGTPPSVGGEPGGTSGSTHGLGYLFTAFRRQRLIADEPVLQLTTFLRSLDLFLELIVLTPGTLTANQVRLAASKAHIIPSSRAFIPACPVLTSLPRSLRPKD